MATSEEDAVELLARGMAEAAEQQRLLVEAVLGAGGERRSSLLAGAGDALLSPLVVEGPEPLSPLPQLFAAAFPLAAKHPLRRVVIDGLVSPAEASQLSSASDRFGDALWDSDEDDYCDASAAARPDWAPDALNEQVLKRVRGALAQHFEERRPLYLAGALLTRHRPASGPSEPHVDKANQGRYDYSAVVYLTTKGVDFAGGDFAFHDACGDSVLEPRAGRCVLFAGGMENLHSVAAVTEGRRVVLACWFTLTAAAGEELE